jgi:AmmeMemoRadiSam system protein A
MSMDAASRALLLGIARSAIEVAVRETPATPFDDTPILREERGVFVTLRRGGRLRGCIGRVDPDGPLSSLLPLMAVAAATQDPRFPALTADELDELHIEISLLTVPMPVSGPAEVEIGRHGLLVFARGRRGVLLPQVATEYQWTADEFLAQTCMKASLPGDAWQEPGARVHSFETEIIAE